MRTFRTVSVGIVVMGTLTIMLLATEHITGSADPSEESISLRVNDKLSPSGRHGQRYRARNPNAITKPSDELHTIYASVL